MQTVFLKCFKVTDYYFPDVSLLHKLSWHLFFFYYFVYRSILKRVYTQATKDLQFSLATWITHSQIKWFKSCQVLIFTI